MGAPLGNKNNSKGKPITDELRKAIVQDDWQRVRAGIQKILDGFAQGERWAVDIVMDRMEGKANSTVDVKHEHSGAIEHRTLSETASWIERVTGRGADSALPESLPH